MIVKTHKTHKTHCICMTVNFPSVLSKELKQGFKLIIDKTNKRCKEMGVVYTIRFFKNEMRVTQKSKKYLNMQSMNKLHEQVKQIFKGISTSVKRC